MLDPRKRTLPNLLSLTPILDTLGQVVRPVLDAVGQRLQAIANLLCAGRVVDRTAYAATGCAYNTTDCPSRRRVSDTERSRCRHM